MYAALLVTPDNEKADFAVLFMHNGGYSVMCGHAVMAVSRYAVDYGRFSRPLGENVQTINKQQLFYSMFKRYNMIQRFEKSPWFHHCGFIKATHFTLKAVFHTYVYH
jgi:hypothetical protein